MAQLVNVKLSRADASPWGFRLQGGKDFGQPLLIQKVNGGSLAERAGLQVGDALVRVNGVDVQDLRHKDAQDAIVRAGNNIDMSVQRGGMSTWKPQVTAVGNVPSPGTPTPLPVTKTSLAAKPASSPIPSGHNVSPRPFGASTPQLNGGDVKALVNKQYNSPIGVYSEETIAETLSAQTEVLATGALGVNFMKNERSYDSQKSEVFKMVQEVDQEPKEPEPAPLSNTKYFSTTSHAVGGRATSPRPLTPIARQMGTAPEPPQDKPYMPPPSPTPGSPVCSECGKHIVGVFVRIKEKNLHVECFKCATCGTSLKNVGYYTINNKLYCDIHAKMVARQNPPAPNLEPVTVAPGARIPSGIVSSPAPAPAPAPLPSSYQPSPFPSSYQPAPLPTSAPAQPPKVARLPTSAPPAPVSLPVSFPPSLPTAAPQSPQPGTLAPLPFHTPSAPAPKPFGSVTAPAPNTTPFAPSAPLSNLSNITAPKPQTDLNPVIWPPIPKKVTVLEPEMDSKERNMQCCKKMSICSQEVCKISEDCRQAMLSINAGDVRPSSPIPDKELEMIVRKNVVAAAHAHAQDGKRSKRETSTSVTNVRCTESVCAQSLATQMLVMGSRGLSPVRGDSPDVLDISSKPHEIKSLLPPASVVRPMSPAQRVVFPPEMPEVMLNRSRSPSPMPRKSCLKKVSEDSSEGAPPMFIGLPVVIPKPGKIIECKIEKLEPKPTRKSPPPVPVVTVTDDFEIDNQEEEQEDDAPQQVESGYSRKVTEISEIDYTSTTSQSQITEQSIREDTLQRMRVGSSKPQEKPLDEKMYTKNEVENIIKEELKKVFLNLEEPPKKDRPPEISINDLPTPIMPGGEMAAALSTASDRPFTPAPFPKLQEMSLRPNEPVRIQAKMEKYVPCPEQTEPYFPPPPPPPEKENRDERTARALREVGCRSPMTEALTIAPSRAYSPLPTTAPVDRSKLAALNAKPTGTSKMAENSPIKPVKPPITLDGTPSAFRPTKNGNGSLIPKSTPLVYIPHLKQEKQDVPMGEKYGIDRNAVARGGKTKQIVAGFEGSSSCEMIEIDETQLAACKSTEVQYGYAVAKNPPPHENVTPTQQKPATSGLRSDHLIPTYQQFVGDIPTRIDRVVSPGPHPVRAPSMDPKPMPQPPNLRPRTPVYHHPDQPDVPKQKTAPSGLQSASMLPVYQQFLGDIPTRIDRVVSPGPHLVKAPSMEPRPMPQTPNLSPRTPVYHGPPNFETQKTGAGLSCWNTNTGSSTKHAKEVICSYNTSAATQEQSTSKSVSQTTTSSKATKVSTRNSRTVSPLAGKPGAVTSSGKQTFKPDIPARSLSPSWKADYVRSVQNLSPITVRLPSPVPPPLPPKGEKTQTTSANVTVKNKPKTTTASQSTTSTVQSGKPPHCGTSKGCGTPPGSPKGPCGTSKGCGTPVECRSPTEGMMTLQDFNKAMSTLENKENTSAMMQNSKLKKTTMTSSSAQQSEACKSSSTLVQRSALVDKQNISSMSQISGMSMMGASNITYSTKSNTSNNEKLAAQKNIKGILKQRGSTLDTKTVPSTTVKPPLQLSSPNISWLPYPTNLPLPRNCGVNPSSSGPNAGGAGGLGGGRSSIAGATAPKRGRGVLNAAVPAGGRTPLCGHCGNQIRGPFITALGKIWCPEHFICVNPKCKRPLQDIGFVEEDDGLYCEYCFEQYLAPPCDKCRNKIKGDCLNAIGKHFHPECFKCSYCEKLFGNNPFFLEDGLPYCENDWNELFTTKCFSCGFPIEAGDRWVEALNNNYHSQCFNCTMCKKNLDGQSFFAKGGRPFCKNHAR